MLVGIPAALVYAFAATTGETASASIWWFVLYGTTASAGSYYGWRFWRGKQQVAMPHDTPIHCTALQGAAISARVQKDIENQVHQASIIETIRADVGKYKTDVDAITAALEKKVDKANVVAATFQSLLTQILSAFSNEDHQQLIEQLHSLPQVHVLVQQNSDLKSELEHYKALMHKLMLVVQALHSEAKVEGFEAKLNS